MHPVVEEGIRLSLRLLQKEGFLHPNTTGMVEWSHTDFFVNFRLYTMDEMVLSYSNNFGEVTQRLSLVYEVPPLGGRRYYWTCPQCQKRVYHLYYNGIHFACRVCCKLWYRCNLLGHRDRMQLKAQKIREKLGASPNVFEPLLMKPKLMKWDKFQELALKENTARYAYLAPFVLGHE